jgi:8-oxo-dGTP diphosphatase
VQRKSADQGSEEEEYLRAYDPSAFPPVGVAVDVALLTIRSGQLCILMIRRGIHPFRGQWSLPGGFVRPEEGLDSAARRELWEEAGTDPDRVHLEQLRTYGNPGRDPRMRVVSVAYLALVPDVPAPTAGSDAMAARFWPVGDLGGPERPPIAFDHGRIVVDAVERARSKLEYTSLAASFVEEPFTIGDLRRVYEAVWGVPLHAANFRRKVLSVPGFVVPTGEDVSVGRGPRTELYHRGRGGLLHPPMLRPGSLEGRDVGD